MTEMASEMCGEVWRRIEPGSNTCTEKFFKHDEMLTDPDDVLWSQSKESAEGESRSPRAGFCRGSAEHHVGISLFALNTINIVGFTFTVISNSKIICIHSVGYIVDFLPTFKHRFSQSCRYVFFALSKSVQSPGTYLPYAVHT